MGLWGAALVVARGVHEIAPPFALAFWRWLGVALLLLPFVWKRLRAELPATSRARRQMLLLSGLMVAGTTTSILAVSYTTAINATVINAIQPAVTAVVAMLLLSERLTRAQALGVLLAFAGIVFMMFQGSLSALLDLTIRSGDPIMFSAVFFWSCYAVALHRETELPSLSVFLFLIAALGTIVSLPLYIAEDLLGRQFQVSAASVGTVIYLSIGATLVAILFWNSAIRTVGANRAAIFVNLIPVFGAGLAILFLGERLFAYHLIGAGLVVTGIFLAVLGRTRRAGERGEH